MLTENDDHSIFCWVSPRESRPTLSGLLATSPKCFILSSYAVPYPASTEGDPPAMTSRELRVNFSLLELEPLGCVAVLDQYPVLARPRFLSTSNEPVRSEVDILWHPFTVYSDVKIVCFGILIQNLGGGRYARIESQRIVLIPAELLEAEAHCTTIYRE